DDGVGDWELLKLKPPPDDAGIAAEPSDPRGEADHGDWGRADDVIGWAQCPPDHGARAEHVEIIPGHEGAPKSRQVAALDHADRPRALVGEVRDAAERPSLSRETARIGERERIVGERVIARLAPQCDERSE